MEGIEEMFREYSEPDEYEVAAQLELFAWRTKEWQREHDKWRNRLRINDLRRYKREHARRVVADPIKGAERREYNRQWMARKRAEARTA